MRGSGDGSGHGGNGVGCGGDWLGLLSRLEGSSGGKFTIHLDSRLSTFDFQLFVMLVAISY